MKEHNYYVYLICCTSNTALYTGMTNDLKRRVYEHKKHLVSGFASKYNCIKLVYFEHSTDVYSVLEREKEIKNWVRRRKNDLIESVNPKWDDLSAGWFE